MDELLKFQRVNECETPEQLAKTIIDFADPETGLIAGRTKSFSADRMASYVKLVVNGEAPANLLTREYGIRQQALYLAYYNKN